MKNCLLKNIKHNKFRYFFIPLFFLILSAIFFVLSYMEITNSLNINSGDVGFGYAASGVISLVLTFISSVVMAVIFFYRKFKSRAI